MIVLPIIHYPSTVVWVDDDALYLKTMTKLLGQKNIFKTFDNSVDGMHFFKNYTPLLPSIGFTRGCREHESYYNAQHMPVDLNIPALTEIRKNPKRYHEVSVMIVDYYMPDMNGIDFCRQLQYLPMKKILFTGKVGSAEAVAAFNEGIIDRFLQKDSPNAVSELQYCITSLQLQYFKSNTRRLISHLEIDRLLPISDPEFSAFFKIWCRENDIQEYFLLDKSGNMYLTNGTGVAMYFIVHTDQSLAEFVKLYGDEEKNADLLLAVSKRERIPFFGVGKEGWQIPSDRWSLCFYPPQVIYGNEKYYWTVVNERS